MQAKIYRAGNRCRRPRRSRMYSYRPHAFGIEENTFLGDRHHHGNAKDTHHSYLLRIASPQLGVETRLCWHPMDLDPIDLSPIVSDPIDFDLVVLGPIDLDRWF